MGEGQVVLFHVSANAEWSTLPLSGLFVEMLERLAVSTRPARPAAEELEGTIWVAEKLLSGFGVVEDAGTRPGVAGAVLAEGVAGPDLPPGLYAEGDRRIDRLRVYRALVPDGGADGKAAAGAIDQELLGTVPVEPDGSFHLSVPVRAPLRLETLGPDGAVLQAMRSCFWVMPGERRGCIGCHEDRALTPPNRHPLALRKPPQPVGIADEAGEEKE